MRFSLLSVFTLTTLVCLLFALVRWQGGWAGVGIFGELMTGAILLARLSKRRVILGLPVPQWTVPEFVAVFTIFLLIYSVSLPSVQM